MSPARPSAHPSQAATVRTSRQIGPPRETRTTDYALAFFAGLDAVNVVATNTGPTTAAGAGTTFTVALTATSALSSSSTLYIDLPSDANDCHSDGTITDISTGSTVGTLAPGQTGLFPPVCNPNEVVGSFNGGAVINSGDRLSASLGAVTLPTHPGSYQFTVSTTGSTASQSNSFTVTADQSVTNVAVSNSGPTTAASGWTTFIASFTTSSTGGMSADAASQFYVDFPSGINDCSSSGPLTDVTTGTVVGSISPGEMGVLPPGCNPTEMVGRFNSGATVRPGDSLRAMLGAHIVLPNTPGLFHVNVYSTSDLLPAAPQTFVVTPSQSVTPPLVTVSDSSPGATGVDYKATFSTSLSGGLSGFGGSEIFLSFPPGTNDCSSNGTVTDLSTNTLVAGFGPGTIGMFPPGCDPVDMNGSLLSGAVVHPNDQLQIDIPNVTNPPVVTGTRITISTTSDVVASSGGNIGVPSVPLNLRAAMANGSIRLLWDPPASAGSQTITHYRVVVTRIDTGVKLDPPQVAEQYISYPTSTVTTVNGLTTDCHATYSVIVAAVNQDGRGPAAALSSLRPSGLTSDVTGQAEPPLVVVLLDGIKTAYNGFSADPLHPGFDNSLDNGYSYCPEDKLGQPTHFGSLGLQEFFGKWNFGYSTPLNRLTHTPTNRFMLDSIAGSGAVVLPFSYNGATLKGRGSKTQFTFNAYQESDTLIHPLKYYYNQLAAEIAGIHYAWPHAKIEVIGHSLGGLVAEDFWQAYVAGPGPYGREFSGIVRHLFSLDSPISGIGILTAIKPQALNPVYREFQSRWNLSYVNASLGSEIAQEDVSLTFRPIGTRFDPTYSSDGSPVSLLNGHDLDFGAPGVLSQFLLSNFDSCNQAENCHLLPPDFASPPVCNITPTDVFLGIGHYVVKYCPPVVSYVDRVVAADLAGVRPPLPN